MSTGSAWRKWDLHIHTPGTKLSDHYKDESASDLWKVFCDKLEGSDVEAFGITDYFSVDNYFKVVEKMKEFYPNSKKVFFPNIELRLEISVNKAGEEVNIHIIFSNGPEASKEKLEEFLYNLKTNVTVGGAVISCKALSTKDDYEKAAIKHSDLKSLLKSTFGDNECYILVAASNNAGLRADGRSPRKLNLSDEIDKISDAFFGGEQNVSWYLKTDRYETAERSKPKPVFAGCDAHSFDDCDNFLGKKYLKKNEATGKEEIIKNVTWIKADLTFEGLKQTLYEPEFRVIISDVIPRAPIRRLESIKFNFPKSSMLKRPGSSEEQELCIKYLKDELTFSPYFTCIIGGRGTGKSTIINILAERLGIRTEFFQKTSNAVYIEGKPIEIQNLPVETIEVKGTDEIEFVSQGQIERLAEGNELTKLVFKERIRELEADFESVDRQYDDVQKVLDESIVLLSSLKESLAIHSDLEKERNTFQKIIDSINDDKYKQITSKIQGINSKLNLIELSEKQYKDLLQKIRSLITSTNLNNDSNGYENRLTAIVNILKDIEEIEPTPDGYTIREKIFNQTESDVAKLKSDLAEVNRELRQFFASKGTSEESIKDSRLASAKIAKANQELEILKQNNDSTRIRLSENFTKVSPIKTIYADTEKLIRQSVDSINSKLKTKDENVLEIQFDYDFDKDLYKDSLFDEFYRTFGKYNLPNTAYEDLKAFLFRIEPDESLLDLSYEDFIRKINSIIDDNALKRTNKYVIVILSIFSNNLNYSIYRTLIRKHLYNLQKYIKIKGTYGKRDLSASSFGQRCTAVIVTLLMTGVKPLVIDEPEAHLDNKLIADYLVNLIKLKKPDRQIIFATHNSNFVINGDAELVYVLEIPQTALFTQVTPTTIENLINREKLLKLEGGKEAFLSRENKYGL